MSLYQQYSLVDQNVISQIEQGLRETYFKTYEEGFLETELGRQDLQANVFKRYNSSIQYVVPWVANHIELKGKMLVEIGSGNGSSTAAFAHFVKSIHGYDIDGPSVEGARKRLEILGLTNTIVDIILGDELVSKLKENHQNGADIVLLFAVLEHQTAKERLETIKVCWQLLNENGLLVVAETPNLLRYFDEHTAILPFLHLVPTEIYARYAKFSPRNGFNDSFEKLGAMSNEDLELIITRWGRGVSYHDFELSLGKDYGKYIVANGFEKETLDWVDVSLEDEILRYYIDTKGLAIPRAFSRAALNLIFKKCHNPESCDDSNIPVFKHITGPEEIAKRDQRIRELELHLHDRIQYLSDIINSKRWKLINAATSPYRYLKTKFMAR